WSCRPACVQLPGNVQLECGAAGLRAEAKFADVAAGVSAGYPAAGAKLPARRTGLTVQISRLQDSQSCLVGLARGARVGLVVNLRQMLKVQTRVDLGCRDIRVAQQFLHC